MNEASSTLTIATFALESGPVLLGAVLAVFGGWIGFEIRAARQDKKELGSIKTVLGDELNSIVSTIKTMHETWTRSGLLYPSDIADLKFNTSSYDNLRPRLFLIADDKLRRDIHAFYKRFKDELTKTEGKVGTLAESQEAKEEQKKIHDIFEKLGAEACTIDERLNKPSIS